MPRLSTDILEELARRNAEHEEEYYLLVSAADVLDLAEGYTPRTVQLMAHTLVDWEDMLRRNAVKPVKARRPKARRTA